jgi:hypothetical protein
MILYFKRTEAEKASCPVLTRTGMRAKGTLAAMYSRPRPAQCNSILSAEQAR